MVDQPSVPDCPSLPQRIDSANRPLRSHVMLQSWRRLLFLHWECPPEVIQASLPPGLNVDTFQGKAYLGIVPFFMQGVRPRFFPGVPLLSKFPEINLRTYVFDHRGAPGVWFYSLDVPRRIAVWLARSLFCLPYFQSRIQSRVDERGWMHYCCSRGQVPTSRPFKYRPGDALGQARPGTLEYFLVERYRLFADCPRSGLYQGRVYHQPYPLRSVEVGDWSEALLPLSGFGQPRRPPEHAVYSDGVDVQIFAIEPVP